MINLLGEHNEVGEIDYDAYKREDLEDAVLSRTGLHECEEMSKHDDIQTKIVAEVQLLLVSPLRRTLETATFCFPHLVGSRPWIALECIRVSNVNDGMSIYTNNRYTD